MTDPSRRDFLGRTLCMGAAVVGASDPWNLLRSVTCAADGTSAGSPNLPDAPIPGGRLVETLLFEDQRRSRRGLNRAYGRGLGGRLRHDLSRLTSETLVTPNETFYIRTRCPDRIDLSRPWRIRVHGPGRAPAYIPIADVERAARPMGVHLLECSGTGTSGLISVADWDGVPVAELLEHVEPASARHRVLISGFDDHSRYDRDYDERGCDWIFTQRQLAETGAFVATRMNGEPLPRDHGYPARLVVPGWYGCTCVKWLDEIRLVDDDAAATRHMRHFARRTHQRGVPRRARDFRSARIDLAAMPVRVERWQVGDRPVHRVIGILWGGTRTTDNLAIRIGRNAPYVPVERCTHETNRTWTLWSHTWRPTRRGVYAISLRVDDPSIRTRRLDSGYYTRAVEIEEV